MAGSTTKRRSAASHQHSQGTKGGKAKGKRRAWRTAATSDRHELYELAVQNVEFEVDFIDRVWRTHRGRLASTLREDFCGTFAASVEWVARRSSNIAVAIDLDASVLAWGRKHNLPKLAEEDYERLDIRKEDVMRDRIEKVDCVVAMNFSYYIFKRREELMKYFRSVYASLVKDGLFVIDAYGGSDSFREIEEERHLDGFTYVWDQNHYNPVTGDVINHIHFRFPDGSEMRKAFTYEWRLWTLPELQESLVEAGFRKATVYWEGTNLKTGEGNGRFRPSTRGEACEGWIAYIVAER
ncbi:MAG: class I SAM-dependent methyltransferase [Phycisphaerae bacterium]|jgi:SAM-dependent methyltransferase|nr:class I SAM-dependent methyltransferase [Phycisphaerae bacterium]